MKIIEKVLFLFLTLFISQETIAQVTNWNSLKNSRHLISANIGWDYSICYGIGYGYNLKTSIPTVINVHFSIPSGGEIMDDFKSKIGGQILILDTNNFKTGIELNGIFRKYNNTLVTLHNFGSEINGVFGTYHSKWFLAGEIGFDKAIVTRFEHTDTYKETLFPGVKSGWYEPASGGNFHYGMQVGLSIKKSDISFAIGKVTTQDFKTTPLIPYYAKVGYVFRW